ncbi:Zn-ribbon domain-containing OB-fold protein [Chloroflexota bacterium]
MEEKAAPEAIGVDSVYRARFQMAAGHYLSRFYTRLKERGEIWAVKCPKCNRTIIPPRIVCGFCKVKIEDTEENWLKLSDKGTVLQRFVITDHEINRVTKEPVGDDNPNTFILLDGGDEFAIIGHLLEEGIDIDKVETGKTRVQAVWRPKEERVGKMRDIKYFQVIEE